MKQTNLWCLIHLPSRRRLDHLTLEAARTMLQAVSPRELQDWMVWTAPWPEWKGLEHAPILFSNGHKDIPSPAPPLREVRRYERVAAQWRLHFVQGNRVFRTTTVNISQGGFYSLNPLPETFIKPEVEVLLAPPNKGENIRTIARIVSPEVAAHFGFLEPENTDAKRLAEYLKNFMRKKVG